MTSGSFININLLYRFSTHNASIPVNRIVNTRLRIPKAQSKMDNPEKLATQGTHDEEKHNKNNLEKLATQCTHDEEKHNKNNLEKLATQDTQDEEKQNKNNPRKLTTQGTQDEEDKAKTIQRN